LALRVASACETMSEFIKALELSELPVGACREVLVAGKAIAVCNLDGQVFAISNVCVHRGGPLGQGTLVGGVLFCPWHAWGYDVTTGTSDVNPDLRVQKFEVKVEAGCVLVKIE
jgi:nitrite reductase (NADH) small subunit